MYSNKNFFYLCKKCKYMIRKRYYSNVVLFVSIERICFIHTKISNLNRILLSVILLLPIIIFKKCDLCLPFYEMYKIGRW